ncbi:dTDP-4-dehydrorhamnose reductase [Aliiroseovarius sediminis]|uniref:dTDP-4-dehydrorhamnose reductase n=1 Tax=Aliiroseovarius sediminis TaxID=2925839 RepID=UPI001F57E212|nr:dTDP-4-dehydrorhamnose reductase [Aliiroseovarius sediminis]MCI2395749.1 dTDP-4-dehydrorhamnose reductase [Aliiroseovarius sediminis]
MKVLVFGKTGQVATELQRQANVVSLGRDQADLSNPDACANVILESDADVVINAAAYTAVDKAEEEEALATIVNGDAPTAMARAAAANGIPFLHVSTDYVFDGTGDHSWKVDDPVGPKNAYGRSKLTGEIGVRASGGNHAILRTSWVFSSHGNNFLKTMLRLSESRDALNIVGDQIGGPTSAADIANALLIMSRSMVAGQQGGTYHFAGAPNTSWSGFATEIFAQASRPTQVSAIPTSEYPTPAARPLNSRLDCSALTQDFGIQAPDWKSSLASALKDLGYDRAAPLFDEGNKL